MIMDFDKTQQEYSIIGEGVGPSFDSNDVYVCVVDDMKGLPGDSASVVALRPFLYENPHEKDDEEKKWELDFECYLRRKSESRIAD
jgi:hypothetical protein